jgi:hypothetical protein
MTPSQITIERALTPNSTVLKPFLTTEESAHYLGLKRQEFLVLKRFLGIQPCGKTRLTGKTPANFYSSKDIHYLYWN